VLALRISFGSFVLADLVMGVREKPDVELVSVGADEIPFGFPVADDEERWLDSGPLEVGVRRASWRSR
jgi:hypothetical protein